MLKITLSTAFLQEYSTSPQQKGAQCNSMAGRLCLLSSDVSFYSMCLVILLLLGSQNYFNSSLTRRLCFNKYRCLTKIKCSVGGGLNQITQEIHTNL